VGNYQLLEEVYKIDTTTSFFPLGSPSTPEELILKMGMPLGSSVSQISKYLDGFYFQWDLYPTIYASALIGFESDKDSFLATCLAQLNGVTGHMSLCPSKS